MLSPETRTLTVVQGRLNYCSTSFGGQKELIADLERHAYDDPPLSSMSNYQHGSRRLCTLVLPDEGRQ